jgi:prevent-host-death family protein
MRTIKATEFRNKWLSVFGHVAATGEPVLVSKRGKPFLQLVPVYDHAPPRDADQAFAQVRVVVPSVPKIA